MKIKKAVSRCSVVARWCARKHGGLTLGIRYDFPVSVVYGSGEVRETQCISIGLLVATITITIRGPVTETIHDWKEE